MEEEASRPGRPSTWVSVMVRMMDMGKVGTDFATMLGAMLMVVYITSFQHLN